jgi:hypothetical protein
LITVCLTFIIFLIPDDAAMGVPSFGFREGFLNKKLIKPVEAEKIFGIYAIKCEFRVKLDGFGAV